MIINTTLSSFLYSVVACVPWRGKRLTGENALGYEVATFLRAETVEGRLNVMWCHVPNEGKVTKAMAALARCLGLIPGWPDLTFLWEGGCLLIELKHGRNDLADNQKRVKAWAALRGVPFHVCRTLDEVKAALIQHQVWRQAA